ncbi:hypothetical protein JKP88DRAFT_180828 [Tribonema minus]|uniref:Uncharacterized protein n=1 Tax=Tribonema minus TaxID=303371 RepID=A0A835YW40_9STRA|nr:hypothetical protein JKP88DRAFT_182084 [Tribonema minus]KAG5185080.1 hypothetical protein JKP88DRAFT_180828 [Tribonema minus]
MFVAITSTTLTQENEHMVADSLAWFNSDRQMAELLLGIIASPRTGPSLRLMDHLVGHYSKEVPVSVPGRGGVPVDLCMEYKRELQASSKKYLDAFKRHMPVEAVVLGRAVRTTLGQLRFIAWFQKLGLHEYLRDNEQAIKQHMNDKMKGTRTALAVCPKRSEAALHRGNFVMEF